MQNVSLDFGFLTRNLSWACHQFLVYRKPSDVSIKGIRMRYAELMAFLSIFKGPVDMN